MVRNAPDQGIQMFDVINKETVNPNNQNADLEMCDPELENMLALKHKPADLSITCACYLDYSKTGARIQLTPC